MHLNCPSCRFPIGADEVDLVKTIAKCKSCNDIFNFESDLKGKELPSRYRQEIVIPPGVEVLHLMEELEIMIKWRQSANRFTFFFSILWNAIIGFITLGVVASGGLGNLLFLLPFILAGAYLLYASVGYLVNKTFVTVDEKRLSIEHRPLNFLIQKDKYFSPDEVDQLFVRRYEVGKTNDQPVYAFAVDLVLKNGKTEKLVEGLHAIDYARYIEQEIEHYLKIKDRPVRGEWDEGL